MKRIFKRGITVIFSAAILFTFSSCGILRSDPYSEYAETSEEISGSILQGVLGQRFEENTEIMQSENAEKLHSAFKDININGSRITLPLMVCDLPEGLTVRRQDGIGESSGYGIFLAEIGTAEKLYATAVIVKKPRLDNKYGVIAALILSSQECSWSVGEIDRSFDGEFLQSKWGKPSGEMPIVDEEHTDYIYVTEAGETAIFIGEANLGMALVDGGASMVFTGSSNMAVLLSLDCSELKSSGELCSFSVFDKFSPDEPVPLLTGERRDFDMNAAFEDNAVVIGKFRSKANAVIGELGGDVILQPFKSDEYNKNSDYIEDKYHFYVFGRYAGIIDALRLKDEPAENAVIYQWEFLVGASGDDVFSEAAVMNVPFCQDDESLAQVYKLYPSKAGIKFCSIAENGCREYFIGYSRLGSGDGRLDMLEVIPTDIGSFSYEMYLTNENEEQ